MTTTVPVLWVSLHDEILARGYADQGFLEAVLARDVWNPSDALSFHHVEIHDRATNFEPRATNGAVVVFNGRSHASPEDVAWLRWFVDSLDWSVVLICGDEEWDFPWREIPQTDRRRVYAMQARPEHVDAGLGMIPGGWYPETHELLEPRREQAELRPFDWFFAGQVTHERRQECVRELRELGNGFLVETERYLEEGIPRPLYFRAMADAKIIPSPSGPYSVDCARTFEALEAGCVPIADVKTAYGPTFDYWALLFGPDHRIPTTDDWSKLPAMIREILDGWPANATRIFAKWQQWKRSWAQDLDFDIRHVAQIPGSGDAPPDDLISVIVTTSPVPRHPSTDHLETVIDSIRAQLPTAEIIVVADGVRPEQEHRRAVYETYLSRLVWLTNYRWKNVVPVIADEWLHQAGATRLALDHASAPFVLFVEHDTPLIGSIDWPGLCAFLQSGEANVIQFHENDTIHPDHEAVVLDRETVHWMGRTELPGDGYPVVPARRTAAWWQRPHLASARFYRRVLRRIPPGARTMIEDALYGQCWADYADHGEAGWHRWKLWIYTPPDGFRRSGHLDSRGEDPKYPMIGVSS